MHAPMGSKSLVDTGVLPHKNRECRTTESRTRAPGPRTRKWNRDPRTGNRDDGQAMLEKVGVQLSLEVLLRRSARFARNRTGDRETASGCFDFRRQYFRRHRRAKLRFLTARQVSCLHTMFPVIGLGTALKRNRQMMPILDEANPSAPSALPS